MTDYLNPHLDPPEIGAMSNLVLAHIGDCVYELLVRSYLVGHRKLTNRELHSDTVRYVSAPAQAEAMKRLLPLLDEEEKAVYRRGRNTRVNSVPKHAGVGAYHAATGLECLFGYLFLRGRRDRVNELFAAVVAEE